MVDSIGNEIYAPTIGARAHTRENIHSDLC